MGNNHKFSLDNFKKWMKEHHEEQTTMSQRPDENGSIIGTLVESKIGVGRLITKMEADGSNLEELAIDFRENGGQVTDVEGKDFVIEVASGCFRLHRAFVKRA